MFSKLLEVNKFKERTTQSKIFKKKEEIKELNYLVENLELNKSNNRKKWKCFSDNMDLKTEKDLTQFKYLISSYYKKDIELTNNIKKTIKEIQAEKRGLEELNDNLKRLRVKQEKLEFMREEIENNES